ncbi:phosphoribosylglycinamide formyltransferase [soil metagenome]
MPGVPSAPRIAVLASGRGSNLQALIDAIAGGTLHARLAGVFSDRAGAAALQRARDADIPAIFLEPRDHPSRAAFDRRLFAEVSAAGVDIVVCAGYLRLLDSEVVNAWHGRMINIHPSLLPAFKGLRTHQRALGAGATIHGASVHFVTPDLDGGPVLSQAPVPVLPGDDVAALSARVLAREHPLLVHSVAVLASGRLRLAEDGIHLDDTRLRRPLQLTANNRLA